MPNAVVAILWLPVAYLIAHLQMEVLRHRDSRQALKAALCDFSVDITLSISVMIFVFTENALIFLAGALGSACATYFGVRRLRKADV